MSESQSHKRAKAKAAGKSGNTETPLPYKRRLDAETKTKAVEIERSGDQKKLEKAAGRLKASNKPRKNLAGATASYGESRHSHEVQRRKRHCEKHVWHKTQISIE